MLRAKGSPTVTRAKSGESLQYLPLVGGKHSVTHKNVSRIEICNCIFNGILSIISSRKEFFQVLRTIILRNIMLLRFEFVPVVKNLLKIFKIHNKIFAF